jgi:hypothetical protein
MADNYPDQAERGTQITEVNATSYDVQAQDMVVILNSDKVFGSRAARASGASVGSTGGTRTAYASIASRASIASAGSVASVATAATVASEPSIASAGSIEAVASAASIASVAAAQSAGSTAAISAVSSTATGKITATCRLKQHVCDFKLVGSHAAFVEIVPPSTSAGELTQTIDKKNKYVLDADGQAIGVFKKLDETDIQVK